MITALAISTLVDASNALERIRAVFTAELVTESLVVDASLTDAIRVGRASFAWVAATPPTVDSTTANEKDGERDKIKKSSKTCKGKNKDKSVTKSPAEPAEEAVFELKDIDLTVARGKLVAIVGAVGSGKSSLLQALIGEMRQTGGSVMFGGSIAYCPQVPWIQVGTPTAHP